MLFEPKNPLVPKGANGQNSSFLNSHLGIGRKTAMEDSIALIQQLSEADGVPGFEDEICALFAQRLSSGGKTGTGIRLGELRSA